MRIRRTVALAGAAFMAFCCNGERLGAQVVVEPGFACEYREDLSSDSLEFFEVLCSERVSADRIDALLGLLSDERVALRGQVMGRIITIADLAAAELVPIAQKKDTILINRVELEMFLESESAVIRLVNIVKILPPSNSQLDILREAYAHHDTKVRVAVMESLKQLPSNCSRTREIRQLLDSGFQDEDPLVVIASAQAIASHGFKEDRIEALLLNYLENEIRVGHAFAGDAVTTRDWRVHLLEVYPRLGSCGDSSKSIILELAKSDEVALRLRAELVLGEVFGIQERTRNVVSIAIDTGAKRALRIEAASALVEVGFDDIGMADSLIEGARNSQGALAATLLRAATSNGSRFMQVLPEFASSDDEIVAAAARRLIRSSSESSKDSDDD